MRIREKRHLQAVDPNAGVPILQAEKPLWQGSPSLLGMIPLLRNWGLVLAALVAWTHGWTPPPLNSVWTILSPANDFLFVGNHDVAVVEHPDDVGRATLFRVREHRNLRTAG
jgi:hypothetical protein